MSSPEAGSGDLTADIFLFMLVSGLLCGKLVDQYLPSDNFLCKLLKLHSKRLRFNIEMNFSLGAWTLFFPVILGSHLSGNHFFETLSK